jgi:prevent-host-death family protein
MRRASISDLHARTSEFVRDVAAGAVIVIERRGKPVAELKPLSRKRGKIRFPDMTRIWNTFPQLSGASTRFIEEDRDRSS